MAVYHNQPISEFLENVRHQAAQSGAPWQVIEKLDELIQLPDKDAEIEKLGDELHDMEKAKDDLHEELQDLLNAILRDPIGQELGENHPALRAAQSALDRHS